jgi:hypothetical protein
MQFIRNLAIAALFIACSAEMTFASTLSSFHAGVIAGSGPIVKVRSDCETLRRACESKGELGERGEGNCRRYREECGNRRSASNCDSLRRACLYKRELGERGEGNCRRYREECRVR